MNDNIYFKIIIIVLIIAYGLFSVYKVGKVFMDHNKTKKEYQLKYKGKYIYQQDFYKWAIAYSFVGIIACVFSVVNLMKQDYVMAAGFLFMTLFSISFILDIMIKRQAFFDDEGFFYENKHYKYRSVLRLEVRKSFVQSYDMFLTGQNSIRISRQMGDMLEVKRKEYKKNKKIK